ncbi:unnamed protein product [Schistocephalus solidus]|uniref:Mediator of RNA polymerase II transcription subunit 13 n=1 Tax=Schistocephalus solidus TaxID=70667 RepID=A0A183T7H0_SCHSO|nr:unnamed protein product [Schistocephalus solidus]
MVESPEDNREFAMGQDTSFIATVTFSVDEVRRVLSQIKPDKSPEPDGIPGLISNCYSINRHLPSPVQLYVTGLGSAFKHSPQSSQGTKQRQPVVPEASSAASTSKHDTPTRPPVSKSTLSRLNLVNAENWDLFLKMVF